MIDYIVAYPFAAGACLLPAIWFVILAHHYRRAISLWWKVVVANFPVMGSIAIIKRQPGVVYVLNPGDGVEVCSGERSLVTPFIDLLTPRLTPEQWQGVEIFLIRAGDTELPSLLRAPPVRKIAETTIIFLESYAISLLLTPTLSIWVTPEQLPLMGFGAGVVLSVGLSAVLARGGMHARLFEAFRNYWREYAANTRSGNPRPKPIGWRDNQSVDDEVPPFQMGLARLHARGKPHWIAAAVLSAIAAVVGATGIRNSELQRQAELDAQQSAQIRQLSAVETPLARPAIQELQRTANEFSLLLFFLAFGLGTALTYAGAKERTALGRGVHGLLDLTRGCASFDEEAALLRRNYSTISKLLSRLQRDMPPFFRQTIPSLQDVLMYGCGAQRPTAKTLESDLLPPSQANAVNVAQLSTRHGSLEKSA